MRRVAQVALVVSAMLASVAEQWLKASRENRGFFVETA